MKIFDITLDLKEGMVSWPGDPPFKRSIISALEAGKSSEVSLITMGSHAGTHIDAPSHKVRGGATLSEIPIDALLGDALVCDMTRIGDRHIEEGDLEALDLAGCERIIFKTRNSANWATAKSFDQSFCALTGGAAEYLVLKGMKLVGVDGLSVDRYKSGTSPAHMPLLTAGVVVVEGLNLDGVPAGLYQLFCGPMKLAGGDGAPARVFLIGSRSD